MIDQDRAQRLYDNMPESNRQHVRTFARRLEGMNGKGDLQTELFVVDSMYRMLEGGLDNIEVILPAIAVWHQDHIIETVGFQA